MGCRTDIRKATHAGRPGAEAAGTPSVSSGGCTPAALGGTRSGSPGHTAAGTAGWRPLLGPRLAHTGPLRRPRPTRRMAAGTAGLGERTRGGGGLCPARGHRALLSLSPHARGCAGAPGGWPWPAPQLRSPHLLHEPILSRSNRHGAWMTQSPIFISSSDLWSIFPSLNTTTGGLLQLKASVYTMHRLLPKPAPASAPQLSVRPPGHPVVLRQKHPGRSQRLCLRVSQGCGSRLLKVRSFPLHSLHLDAR